MHRHAAGHAPALIPDDATRERVLVANVRPNSMDLNDARRPAMKKSLSGAGCTAVAHGGAHAGYPSRPSPWWFRFRGRRRDNAARIIAQGLSQVSGQSALVNVSPNGHRPFLNFAILRHALLPAINPALRKLPHDPAQDFIPVSWRASSACPTSWWPRRHRPTTPSDYARRPGPARQAHLCVVMAQGQPGAQMAGRAIGRSAQKIDTVHVPYIGAPAIVDVMGGQGGRKG